MLKLIWSGIVTGAAMLVWPYLEPPGPFDKSFSPAMEDALTAPEKVFVLRLTPATGSGERRLFNTEVESRVSPPEGWDEDARLLVLPLCRRNESQKAKGDRPRPSHAIRFVGERLTVDVAVCLKLGNAWFIEQNSVRPFYSRSLDDGGEGFRGLLRQIWPRCESLLR